MQNHKGWAANQRARQEQGQMLMLNVGEVPTTNMSKNCWEPRKGSQWVAVSGVGYT